MNSVAPPTKMDMLIAKRLTARILGSAEAFEYQGITFFELGGGWLLGLSPDSAGRLRVVACYGATEVATLWALAWDHGRLAALVRGLRAEVATLVA
jgi:uncharacterized membrane protein